MAKYVVTGGAGFIGSHLVEALLSQSEEVAVIDNFTTGRRENIQSFLKEIELFDIDLRDLSALKKAMEGAEYVFHQAALPSVPRSVKNPLESHENNLTGTLNALLAAKENEVKRFIYAASSSAYGDAKAEKKHEELLPNPISPYGVAKLGGEYYCQSFYETYGLETVCLRYFNVFGPRQNPHSPYTGVMAIFIPLMLQDKQPTIYGDGSATRDYTFIQNVVYANLLARDAEDAPGKILNVACGERWSVKDVVDTINNILGKTIQPVYATPRPGDIQHSCASIEKAKEILNFRPQVSFEEGIKKTIDWYRQELDL